MTIKSQESDFILAPASLNLNTEYAAWQRRNQKKSPPPYPYPWRGRKRVGEFFTKIKELERWWYRESINNDFIVFFVRVL
jgi:hypothetical protein